MPLPLDHYKHGRQYTGPCFNTTLVLTNGTIGVIKTPEWDNTIEKCPYKSLPEVEINIDIEYLLHFVSTFVKWTFIVFYLDFSWISILICSGRWVNFPLDQWQCHALGRHEAWCNVWRDMTWRISDVNQRGPPRKNIVTATGWHLCRFTKLQIWLTTFSNQGTWRLNLLFRYNIYK